MREPALLLLELFLALERALHHASQGGSRAPPLPPAVLSFFAANRRVCEEWLQGVRPLLMQVPFFLCTSSQHGHRKTEAYNPRAHPSLCLSLSLS